MAPRLPPVVRLVDAAPKAKTGKNLAWQPEHVHRQLVEILVAVGATEDAVLRELRRQHLPCKSKRTLRRTFKEELEHGRERRVLGYGVKMHAIAMSDAPGNQAALRYMLSVLGGPMWQNVRQEDEMPQVAQTDEEVVHFYMPPNGRDQPVGEEEDGPIIDGIAAEPVDGQAE